MQVRISRHFPDRFPGLKRIGLRIVPIVDPERSDLREPAVETVMESRRALDAAWTQEELNMTHSRETPTVSGIKMPSEDFILRGRRGTEEVSELAVGPIGNTAGTSTVDKSTYPTDHETANPESVERGEELQSQQILLSKTTEVVPNEDPIPNAEETLEPTIPSAAEEQGEDKGLEEDEPISPLPTVEPDIDVRPLRGDRFRVVSLANFLSRPMTEKPDNIEIWSAERPPTKIFSLKNSGDSEQDIDWNNLWKFKGPGIHPVRSDLKIIDLPNPPQSMAQLADHPHRAGFISAMQKEWGAAMAMGTCEETALPEGRKAIPLVWRFTYKGKGEFLEKYKARICVRGDLQKPGIDYDPENIFAPVIRGATMRTAIALLGTDPRKMYITSCDISNAFLNATPKEKVFIRWPPGFPTVDVKNVYRLLRSLYGLCQSPKEWYECLRDWLREKRYNQSKADPCLWTKKGPDGSLRLILVYVDDMLILADDKTIAAEVKEMFRGQFNMTEVEDADKVIGVEIFRVKGGICLGQPTYAKTLMEKADLWIENENRKYPINPISESWTHDERSGYLDRKEKDFYVSFLMSIAWMSQQTRPDLCASASILARYLGKPTKSDLAALKRLLLYVRGSWNDVLYYQDSRKGEFIHEESALHIRDKPPGDICSYVDADWANDADRVSRSGVVILARGAPIVWMSKKQSMVATSSTEAEYYAAAASVAEVAGVRSVLVDLGMEQKTPTRIYEDNKSCIAIAYKPMHHGRTKHFDIKAHFLRDRIEKEEVEIKYCPTSEMIADMLTKSLPGPQHQRLKRLANIRPLSSFEIVKLNP
jgi:hypothetical protein